MCSSDLALEQHSVAHDRRRGEFTQHPHAGGEHVTQLIGGRPVRAQAHQVLGPDGAGFYRWQTGTHSGSCKTLEEAKRMVELAVEHGASQLGLFDAPDRDAPDRDAPNASDASPSATAS